MYSARATPVTANRRLRWRFSLRTLFGLMAAAALACAIGRAFVRGDPTWFLGIGAFCYGGVVALPTFAFIASLVVLGTKSTWGERGGILFAGAVAAAAWITFIVIVLGRWPQLCVAYSLVAVAILGFVVWNSWQTPLGPSPEASLERLLRAKRESTHKR